VTSNHHLVAMAKTPEPTPEDHSLATAIGKTLGTIAHKAGLGNAVRAPKKRIPRKLKKQAKKSTTGSAKNTAPAKRELITPHQGDKRYTRRSEEGQFTTSQDDVGKSLAADRRKKAKAVVPKGQGDRGDQKRKPAGRTTK
jgi:hypothetical protein